VKFVPAEVPVSLVPSSGKVFQKQKRKFEELSGDPIVSPSPSPSSEGEERASQQFVEFQAPAGVLKMTQSPTRGGDSNLSTQDIADECDSMPPDLEAELIRLAPRPRLPEPHYLPAQNTPLAEVGTQGANDLNTKDLDPGADTKDLDPGTTEEEEDYYYDSDEEEEEEEEEEPYVDPINDPVLDFMPPPSSPYRRARIGGASPRPSRRHKKCTDRSSEWFGWFIPDEPPEGWNSDLW